MAGNECRGQSCNNTDMTIDDDDHHHDEDDEGNTGCLKRTSDESQSHGMLLLNTCFICYHVIVLSNC